MVKILRTATGCMASIGLINELIKKGVEVICVDANPISVGLYYCQKKYVVPKGNDPNFITELLKICKKEKVDAILSGPEEEIINIAKNKEIFLKEGIVPIVPDYETVKITYDKLKTYEFFIKNGIPTPKTYKLKDILNLEDINFPIVLKPRFGRGGSGVYIAEDIEDLNYCITKKCKSKTDYIAQEYIEGTEYTIDIFSDMDGNVLSIVPRKRLSVESGISVKSITSYNETIIKYAEKIAKKLNIKGPANIQCILKDNKPYFIEINPRFGGGSILSIKADPTIIENLIRIIKGEKPIPSRGFKKNLLMLRYYSEIFVGCDGNESSHI